MRSWIKKYSGLLVGLVLVALIAAYLWRVDFHEVGRFVYELRWYLPLIILSTGSAYLLATMAWRQTFFAVEDRPPGIARLYIIRHLGEVLTLINPTNIIAGEYSKIYLLGKEGVRRESGLTSIVLSRALIILSYFLLLTIAILLFFFHPAADQGISVWMVLGGSILLFVSLSYLLVSKNLVVYGAFRFIFSSFSICAPFLSKLRSLNLAIYRFYQRKKIHLGAAFGLSLLHWIVGTLEFYIILNGLGLEVGYMDALLLEMGVVVFKSIGGFVPGQIGVEEYGNLIMLEIIGIPGSEIWLAVSIMRRARQLIWLGIGLLFLGVLHKSIQWKFSA